VLIKPSEKRIMDFIPQRDTEDNMKYRFCRSLEQYGFKFFLQYPSRWNEAPGCRFDIVIHDGRYIKALIEVKRKSTNPDRERKWLRSRQAQKYQSFGVPVFLIFNDKDFVDTLNQMLEVIK
jgi:hypothetical protein